jgi:hypothetical protein
MANGMDGRDEAWEDFDRGELDPEFEKAMKDNAALIVKINEDSISKLAAMFVDPEDQDNYAVARNSIETMVTTIASGAFLAGSTFQLTRLRGGENGGSN